MSVLSNEFQLNGFIELLEQEMMTSDSSSISQQTSMDRLSRECSVTLRPKSPGSLPDDDVDDSVIQEVRKRVLETASRSPEHFDDCDIKWIEETDDVIFRNVLVHKDAHPMQSNAEKMYTVVHDGVIATLKWRREFGVNAVTDEDIPREFLQAKAVLFYTGSDGRLYVYLKVRKYRKFSRIWVDACIRFALHEIDKRLKKFSYTNRRGIYELRPVIILDGQNTGMAQVDLKNFFIGRGIFVNHYPKTFREIWIYGMPWWARPILSICLKAMPAYVTQFVKLVDSCSLIRDIGTENVPRSLGGAMDEEYSEPPARTVTMDELGRMVGASREEIKRLTQYLRSIAE